MSRLNQLIVSLRQEISAPQNEVIWKEAQRRHPVLRKHDTATSVLDLMNDTSRKSFAHKDLLTQVFIAEQKRTHTPFWTSMLLVAFQPMLSRLRGRIRGTAISKDDLDQLVIVAFLNVVERFALTKKRNRTTILLKQYTEKQVFQTLRTRQDEPEQLRSLHQLMRHLRSPILMQDKSMNRTLPDTDEAASWLLKIADGKIPRERVEVVIATFLQGESLKTYIRRANVCRDGECPERVYQRIKRQRLRTVDRLRELTEELSCPLEESEPLLSDDDDESEIDVEHATYDRWTPEMFS